VTFARIARRKDPLDGQRVRMLGRLRRHGGVELLVLPDGSKRMIPQTWTGAEPPQSHRRRLLRRPTPHRAAGQRGSGKSQSTTGWFAITIARSRSVHRSDGEGICGRGQAAC
jgi:hypothetical protein